MLASISHAFSSQFPLYFHHHHGTMWGKSSQIAVVKMLLLESQILNSKSAHKILQECDLCSYYWFPSFFMMEYLMCKTTHECRAGWRASGYLFGFSETTPHIWRRTRSDPNWCNFSELFHVSTGQIPWCRNQWERLPWRFKPIKLGGFIVLDHIKIFIIGDVRVA